MKVLFPAARCQDARRGSFPRRLLIALTALTALTVIGTAAAQPALAGRWQYLQPPDRQGEVLDILLEGGRHRAVMNGLERAGEHGLFYYVVEASDFSVAQDGSIGFTIGERVFFSKRPPLSRLGSEGNVGMTRDTLRFHGKMEGGMLVLECRGAPGACPDAVMRFERLGR